MNKPNRYRVSEINNGHVKVLNIFDAPCTRDALEVARSIIPCGQDLYINNRSFGSLMVGSKVYEFAPLFDEEKNNNDNN